MFLSFFLDFFLHSPERALVEQETPLILFEALNSIYRSDSKEFKIGPGDIRQLFQRLMKEIGEPVDFELPHWMLLSSCSVNCKCDKSCFNKPFHRRPKKEMKIIQIEKCGSGVVADENIMQGEFIIENIGEGGLMLGADQDCHCGAVVCRQKLGIKANKSKFPSSAYPRHVLDQTRIPHNYTGEVLRIIRPASKRSFGIIKRFYKKTLDGGIELLDLAQVDWELLAFTGVKPLSGAFVPNENLGAKGWSSGMSVSLAGPDGRVLGGGLAGMLVAAGPV
ncbi:hypothetical protein L2E82_50115 [Cichorium intybus]|nr:hypothetical protein L2E82_50115 [Cichorium intybus]